jgi:hypothetical protein
MTSDRIKEIQLQTAYPNSVSIRQALLQVWNECEQEQLLKNNCSATIAIKNWWINQKKLWSDMFAYNRENGYW